ncbi:MAG: phosphonate metabolism transcriptional regulator PhnF [Maricaulaceae bacterium]
MDTPTQGAGRRSVLWRRIAEDLEQRIAQRKLAPGDRLPTENDLAAEYGVNRHTVRRALGDLQARGFVEVTQGRGSFVRRPVISYYIDAKTDFTSVVRRQHGAPHKQDVSQDVIPAEPQVAEALGLAPGAPVARIEKIGYADNAPVAMSRHYFPQNRMSDILDVYRQEGAIVKTFDALGLSDWRRLRTRVSARLATPHEQAVLDLPRYAPLLVAEAVTVDGADRPIEFAATRFASDRAEIVFEIPPESAVGAPEAGWEEAAPPLRSTA